jgi:hypothetical protein
MSPRLITQKRRSNKITNLSLLTYVEKNLKPCTPWRISKLQFWHSFEGASADVCLPDASFLEDKVEGSLCGSKGEGDANANSFNLDLLACVLAAASLNNDNDKRGGSAFLQKLSLLFTHIYIPLLMEMMMIQCLALI